MRILISVFLFLIPLISSAAKTLITVGTLAAAQDSAVVAQYQSFVISVLEETEFQVTPKALPIRRSFDGLIKGDLDAVVYDDMTIKDGREELVTVSFPIAFTTVRLFYRADLNHFDNENLEK